MQAQSELAFSRHQSRRRAPALVPVLCVGQSAEPERHRWSVDRGKITSSLPAVHYPPYLPQI